MVPHKLLKVFHEQWVWFSGRHEVTFTFFHCCILLTGSREVSGTASTVAAGAHQQHLSWG